MRQRSTRAAATCIFAPRRFCWRRGRRAAAIARWKQALDVLAAPAGRAAADTAPLVAALDSIGSRRLLPELREPADKMVRVYLARNGNVSRRRAAARRVPGAERPGGRHPLVDRPEPRRRESGRHARRDRESALAARPAARSCLRAHRRGQRGNRLRASTARRRRRRRLSSRAGRCCGSDCSSIPTDGARRGAVARVARRDAGQARQRHTALEALSRRPRRARSKRCSIDMRARSAGR